MTTEFSQQWQQAREQVETYLSTYWQERQQQKVEGTEAYMSAIAYSYLGGGKRFRPVLSCFAAEAVGISHQQVLAFAAAVEMVHSFSLVHDDLPCMDNDDYRRGRPSLHKAFSEDLALLAGDGMIFEAIQCLLAGYGEQPAVALELIQCLIDASGSCGMIAGQVLDMQAQKHRFEIAELEKVHLYKTGALIRCATEGPAILAATGSAHREALREYGELLGLCFQIKDDLLEVEDNKVEQGSFPGIIGVIASNKLLQDISQQAKQSLTRLPGTTACLAAMVDYNLSRSH